MRVPKYFLLVLLLTAFYAVMTHFHLHDYFTDYFARAPLIEDIAKIPLRSLHFQILNDRHPFGPIPYNYDFYVCLLAMFVKFFGVGSLLVLKIAGLFNFVLLALGLHLFLKEYYSDSQLSLYLLPLMLFFWGKSWDYSGVYDMGAQVINLTCPSSFALSLSFAALYFFVKYLREGRIKYWICLAILLPVIFLAHLLPAFFLFVTMTILFLCEKKFTLKNIFSLLLLLFATFLLASAWPYFSFLKLLKEGFALQSMFDPAFYFSTGHLWRLGPVLLGIPVVFRYALQKRNPLVVFGFFVFSLGYGAGFLLTNPVAWRLLFYITFFLHLGLALYLRENFSVLSRPLILTKTNAFTVLLVGIAAICMAYQSMGITAKELGYRSFKEAFYFVQNNEKRGLGFEKRFQFLGSLVSPDDRVLSDEGTSLVIATFGGKPVLDRGSYYDPFQKSLNEKKRDLKEFFDLQTPLNRRLEIIKKCRAKYVLWDSERVSNPLPADLKKAGQVLYQKGTLTLIKIN